jgi:hypothetical protein
MWWFLKKENVQTPDVDASASPRVRSEAQLLAQLPDPGPTSHEVAIKIWLPELVARLLKSVTDYEGVSQSSWVRERLYGYLYGQAALLARRIRAKREGIETPMFSRKPVDRASGRWVYKVPQLGKNTIAFKVWVSQQMRDDLEILAKHAGVGLSPFVREAIVGDLLGRGSLPERPEIMGVPTAAALAWERDEAVPTETIEEAAFDGLCEADRVWTES